MLGYQPVMFFNDSFDYLHVATDPYPHPLRPDGYAFLLYILKPFHSFALVAALQHLMGLGMGVMIYALLRRKFGLPGWGAALAAAPVLLDAYQLQLEHLVLSDTLFTFLVMSAVTLLLWHDRPSWKIAAAVGLIVGMAWLTRSVGMPVLLGVLVFMLIRRSGWKPIAVTLAACMLPVLAYMGWYKADSDKFAITESNGIFLYARVYKFADCHQMKDLPVREYPLCTETNRLPNSQDGIWNAQSPLNRYTGTRFSPENNALGNDFAKRAITAQPGDYLQVVAHDFFRVFRWERTVFPTRPPTRSTSSRRRAGSCPTGTCRAAGRVPGGQGVRARQRADAGGGAVRRLSPAATRTCSTCAGRCSAASSCSAWRGWSRCGAGSAARRCCRGRSRPGCCSRLPRPPSSTTGTRCPPSRWRRSPPGWRSRRGPRDGRRVGRLPGAGPARRTPRTGRAGDRDQGPRGRRELSPYPVRFTRRACGGGGRPSPHRCRCGPWGPRPPCRASPRAPSRSGSGTSGSTGPSTAS